MENHFFFKSKKSNLYGTLFDPDTNQKFEHGVIFCHPFAEEKKSSQAILVNLARVICKNNIPVLMFDYYGCGDSEGDFKDSNLSLWMENTFDAVNMFKNTTGLKKIMLIGLRLGGFIASKVAEKLNNIEEVILIEPVLTPAHYFKYLLRQKQIRELKTFGEIRSNKDGLIEELKKTKKVDLDGYEISYNFYLDLIKHDKIDFLNTNLKYSLLHITYKNKILKEYKELSGNISIKQIKMLPFWNRIEKCDYTNLVKEIDLKFKYCE